MAGNLPSLFDDDMFFSDPGEAKKPASKKKQANASATSGAAIPPPEESRTESAEGAERAGRAQAKPAAAAQTEVAPETARPGPEARPPGSAATAHAASVKPSLELPPDRPVAHLDYHAVSQIPSGASHPATTAQPSTPAREGDPEQQTIPQPAAREENVMQEETAAQEATAAAGQESPASPLHRLQEPEPEQQTGPQPTETIAPDESIAPEETAPPEESASNHPAPGQKSSSFSLGEVEVIGPKRPDPEGPGGVKDPSTGKGSEAPDDGDGPAGPSEPLAKDHIGLPEWQLDKNYYTIGEVAGFFKVNISHIRFWTKEFKLKPRTTRKGDRLYTPEQIGRLRLIHHLVKEKKHTLQGAKERLQSGPEKVSHKLQLKDALTALRATLVELRKELG